LILIIHCSPLIYVFPLISPLISPLVFILSMASDWFIAQIPCPASAAFPKALPVHGAMSAFGDQVR
jgi:hypothetical protein